MDTLPVISAFTPDSHLLQVAWQPLVITESAQAVYAQLLGYVTAHSISRILLDLRQQEPTAMEPDQHWVACQLLPSLLMQPASEAPPRVACVLPPAYHQQLLADADDLTNQSELLALQYFSDYPTALLWLRQEAA